MIWIAASVELAKASAGYGGWEDFGVLLALQFANAFGESRACFLLSFPSALTGWRLHTRGRGEAAARLSSSQGGESNSARNGVLTMRVRSCGAAGDAHAKSQPR